MSDKQGAPTLPPLAGGGGNNGSSNTGASQQTVSLQQVLASAQGLNVLTTGGGQQFVIASQVPGLTQVLSSGATTNASGIQQVGFPRIVNIGGNSPRVSVVGVASATGSPLASPSRQTSGTTTTTKVVLATSPKLVRTSIGNMFVAPSSQVSPGQSSPARKKLRLSETTEKITASDDVITTTTTTTAAAAAAAAATTTTTTTTTGYRRRIMEHKMKRMRAIREKYAENASELFFLHVGGNMMDFHTWKRRPPTAQYLHFLRQHRLDPEDDDEDLTVALPPLLNTVQDLGVQSTSCGISTTTGTVTCISATTTTTTIATPVTQSNEVKITGVGVTPVAVSTTLPAAVAQLSQQGGTPLVPEVQKPQTTAQVTCTVAEKPLVVNTDTPAILTPSKPTTTATVTTATTMSTVLTTATTMTTSTTVVSSVSTVSSPQPIVKLVKLPSATGAATVTTVSCETQNNQEQIVEKAKQEAYVMQRIAELQRDGLWSERRLPKVQEPPRTKAHWDYLLEEMVWLAADFAQERKWKKAAAKKCARMVQKHFQEKAIQAQKAEKLQELRLKKIAGFVAKEIKTFWTNVEKLVEFKQQTRLEEKRKKALDQHLNFIVGQTEKYSTWLTEGLNKAEGTQSVPASINSSRISSPVPTNKQHSDDEFEPNQSSEDDEETIAKAEEEMKSTTNHKEEVELLKKESEIPLEDLLKELPPNYLEERDKSLSPNARETQDEENESENTDGDIEFTVASDESSDDENTIMEQEKLEENTNHQKELDDLKAENEMSIDELMAKYGNMQNTPMDVDGDTDRESGGDSEKDDDDRHEDKTESESESEDETKSNEEDSQTQSDDETGVGLKSLLEDLSGDKPEEKNKNPSGEQSDNDNEMDDVAALAESIQPKGNTLLTTSVVTKIPFLLKHSLREYQHIGLDWLVTMYDRKLNGILADEMGLGKTIQTIALLAHLACEKGNWGPHLIIVPTSVMLNWEMECKKWCPGFKILTYYGTQKERKQKRTGWTKPNAFHICITSYKLVIQDHQSFRRKKWKYLILDEAQNIKNFKSQRWQLLLNFQTQRRLLLTGTPLQNNLMELWSLMHFLMPNVFQSHREFKEWFSNPVTGMIEGNSEYNENIIRRLHKVLRPFLLRRLKTEVEKQLPKKYEHVLMCRLSKRQRYLYDDFMSRAKTKETLASGNLLSVINVLMQLRKVCNHPNLFEVRPTVSPFQMDSIEFVTASLAWSALDYDPFKHVDLSCLNLLLVNLELTLTAFVAHRMNRFQTPRKLIEEIDGTPEPGPRCPSGKIKINVRLSNQAKAPVAPPPPPPPQSVQPRMKNLTGIVQNPRVGTSPLIKTINNQTTPGQGVTLRVAGGQQLQGYSVQLVQHQGSVKAIPVGTLAHNPTGTASVTTTSATGVNAQRLTVGNANIRDGFQRLTAQTVTVKQGDSVQRIAVPSFAQLVQTSTGRHIILTSNQQNTNTVSFPVMTPGGQRLTVLSKSLMGLSTANKVVGGVVATTTSAGGRLGMRVPPLNVSSSPGQQAASVALQHQAQQQQQQQQQQQLRCGIVTRNAQKDTVKTQAKEQPKSEFYIPQLEEDRRQRRQAKLRTIANINERRCAACPLYGEDLFTALRIGKPSSGCEWHNGWVNCKTAKESPRTRRQFFSRTEALAAAIKSTEQIVEELKEIFQRFVVYVPAVRAPMPRFHVSHPPPHKYWAQQRLHLELQQEIEPKLRVLHPVAGAMMTQFPDPRLIQYDCGKLQSLDRLLRKLKVGSHRVLIFTQMTRMLDVLEAFLNFHGHIYLRLDGATRVDQRQVLMERFNGDKRIFCFILSTRSGGVGVNLTGADTVIFYDSDWNPTMDAQAQDRCHRIGQTRDVHIYRLVSEKTVEENILKKANQKRLLGDLAIEGGNFTTAYFKSSTIQDLFNVDQTENDASTRMADVLDQNRERERALHRELAVSSAAAAAATTTTTFTGTQPSEEKVAIGALESALAAAEEDLDVQAAKTAKAEAVADLAEFDENIPLDDADKEDAAQVSKAEIEVQNLVSQLTPVERYAMKFVEESEGTFSAAQLAAAERELEQQKKEWELDRLRALREEEERRLRMADDDDDDKPLTFGREDAQNQVNNTSNTKKLGIKRRARDSVGAERVATRRTSLRRASRNIRVGESSGTETETTTDSDESESQDDDLVDDSHDEESSHTESQSQGDEEEEEEGENEDNGDDNDGNLQDDESEDVYEGENENEEIRDTRNDCEARGTRGGGGGGCSKRRNRSNKLSDRNNRFDLNSPRTRSRGNVKINLWTLDVSPILPGVKPNFRNRRTGPRARKKSADTKADEIFAFPVAPVGSPKKAVNLNNSSEESTNVLNETENREDRTVAEVSVSPRRKNSLINSAEAESHHRQTLCTDANSSPVRSPKIAQVETLIDEKMLEMSGNMEMSQSDETAEHERTFPFSCHSKNSVDDNCDNISSIIPPNAPRLEIVLNDLAMRSPENTNKKSHTVQTNNAINILRSTRSKPLHVKRLTQTFDASFNESGVNCKFESESVIVDKSTKSSSTPVHVTRSMHKLSTQFGKSSGSSNEDSENREGNPLDVTTNHNHNVGSAIDVGESENNMKLDGKIETDSVSSFEKESNEKIVSLSGKLAITPVSKSNRRTKVTSVSPDREKSSSGDSQSESSDGSSTLRKKMVIGRSRNKNHIEELAKNTEIVVENEENSEEPCDASTMSDNNKLQDEKSENRFSECDETESMDNSARKNTTGDEKVNEDSQESEIDETASNFESEIVGDYETARKEVKIHEEKIEEESTVSSSELEMKKEESNCATFVSPTSSVSLGPKLVLDSKIRLRRPDTPFPGVLTRSAKSVTLNPEGRRKGRLSGNCPDVQDVETMGQSISKMIAKPGNVKTVDTLSNESSRITRSSFATPSNPPAVLQPQVQSSSCAKTLEKKLTSDLSTSVKFDESQIEESLPSLALEETVQSNTRPVTRSSLSEVTSKVPPLTNERPTTRSSKPSLDNGFLLPQTQHLRKTKSLAAVQKQQQNTNDTSDFSVQPATRLTRKSSTGDGTVATISSSTPKKRPDTPLPPGTEGSARVTRSGVDFKVLNSSLTRIRNVRRSTTAIVDGKPTTNEGRPRRSISPPESTLRTSVKDTNDTDSNGNAVVVESLAKQRSDEAVSPVSAYQETNEKPQRTAKVVAILTIDSLSRSNYSNKGASSNTTTSGGGSKETVNKKQDSSLQHSAATGNSLSDSESKNATSGGTTPTAIVDIDSESSESESCRESSSSSSSYHRTILRRRTVKRTRSSPVTRQLTSGGGKHDSDVQIVEIVDDDEVQASPPLKKHVRLNSGTIDKLNNSSAS